MDGLVARDDGIYHTTMHTFQHTYLHDCLQLANSLYITVLNHTLLLFLSHTVKVVAKTVAIMKSLVLFSLLVHQYNIVARVPSSKGGIGFLRSLCSRGIACVPPRKGYYIST